MRTLCGLGLLLMSCGGGASSTLTLSANGSVTQGAEHQFSVNSGWLTEADSFGVGDGSGLSYGPLFVSKTATGASRVDFRIDSTTEPLRLGSPTWVVSLKVLFTDGQQFEFETEPSAVFIKRIRDTGDRQKPFEIIGSIKGKANATNLNVGDASAAELSGDFVFEVPCHSEGSALFFTPSPLLCGSNMSNGTFSSQPSEGDYAQVTSDCPAALQTTFLDGTHYSYSVTSLKVGAAQSLSCRKVGSDEDGEAPAPMSANRVCTGSASIEAEGCTWQVDAVSTPARLVVINALANEGCSRPAGRACQIVAQ